MPISSINRWNYKIINLLIAWAFAKDNSQRKNCIGFSKSKIHPPPLLYLSRYSKNTPPLCLRKCDEKGAGELTPWACIIPSRWGKVFFLGNPPFGKKNVFNMSFSSERKSIRFSGGKPGVVYFPTNFFLEKRYLHMCDIQCLFLQCCKLNIMYFTPRI